MEKPLPDTVPAPSAPPASRSQRRRVRPEVSVCIVNWNCRHRLRACLRSLRGQLQKVRLEIIVVDNGSTDGAAAMVARRFPRVQLIRNPHNDSFARANNQAAARARGRYLFFLNNDTIVPPGALRGLLDYAEAHPEVGIVAPQLCHPDGRPQVSGRLRPTPAALLHRTMLCRCTGLFRVAYRRFRLRDADRTITQPVEVLMGAALLVPRRVFKACGGWDEDYTFGGEDIDLCVRIGQRHAVIYHPEVSVIHFGRLSSRRHAGYAYTHTVIGITRFLRKHGCGKVTLLLYKAALTLDLPLQGLGHGLQYLWRRLCGRRLRAARSLRLLQSLGHFACHGLGELWRV